MNWKIILLAMGLCFMTEVALAQEEHRAESSKKVSEGEHESMKGSHRLTLGLGHTHISEGKVDGETQWLVAASWSFNYDYWLSDKWAVGLQNDIILETFKIENHEQELVERSRPWAIVPVAIFKPGKHWSFLGGVGKEIASGRNLTLTRLGIEYGHELPKHWELGAALVWDNKWNYYNSWGLAITISKVWPKKHP
jgi:hypothetical protein